MSDPMSQIGTAMGKVGGWAKDTYGAMKSGVKDAVHKAPDMIRHMGVNPNPPSATAGLPVTKKRTTDIQLPPMKRKATAGAYGKGRGLSKGR